MSGRFENRLDLLHDMLVIKKVYEMLLGEIGSKVGLTKIETCVVAFLAANSEMDTARDIADFLMITKSHVSKAVVNLTGKGYICGGKSESDRRQVHLRLTSSADGIVSEIKRCQSELIEALEEGISDREYERLCGMCRIIAKNAASYMERESHSEK